MVSTPCKICSTATATHGTALALGRYEAHYLVCPNCGFVSVQDPHWLAEAYRSAIAEEDLGSLWRAVRYSKAVKSLLTFGGFDREGWYYLPSAGQHIAFYSHRSLELIGKRLGLRSYSRGREIHMLSSKTLPECLFNTIANPRLAKWTDLFISRPSLLEKDFQRGLDRKRGEAC